MAQEKVITGPLLLALFSTTIGSSYVFGYCVGVLNAPAALIRNWIQNESYPSLHGSYPSDASVAEMWSWIMASWTLGGAAGGLICGFLADKLGRKRGIMANSFIILLGAIIQCISKVTGVFWLLLIGRIILGVGCGICSSLPPMYLTEIAPLKLRGSFGSLNTAVVIFGIFAAQVLGHPSILGTEQHWPILLAFTGVSPIINLLTMPFCVESPRYLVSIKKDPVKARSELIKLRQTENVDDEMDSMLAATNVTAKGELVSDTPTGSFWWGMTVCLVNHMSQQFTGMTAVIFFSATIFREQAQMSSDQAVGATLGIGATFLAGSIASTLVIERLGRRVLMLGGYAGTIVFGVLIFVVLHLLAIDKGKFQIAAYFAIVFVYLFVGCFSLGPSSIPWFYTNELFDARQKGRANMIATTVNWLTGFLVSYSFLPLKEVISEYIFLVYAGLVSLGFIFLFFYAPETKGRQCKEVEKELEARKPLWVNTCC